MLLVDIELGHVSLARISTQTTNQLFPHLGGKVGRLQKIILYPRDIIRMMRRGRRYCSPSLPGMCLQAPESVLSEQQLPSMICWRDAELDFCLRFEGGKKVLSSAKEDDLYDFKRAR